LKTARVLDHYGIADTMLINFADPVEGGIEVIKALASELRASLAVSYMGGGEHEKRGSVEIQKMRVGVFPSPERAVRGIAAAAWKAGYDRRLIQ
jgi:acyl-CoA synthetase (NDP forming)